MPQPPRRAAQDHHCRIRSAAVIVAVALILLPRNQVVGQQIGELEESVQPKSSIEIPSNELIGPWAMDPIDVEGLSPMIEQVGYEREICPAFLEPPRSEGVQVGKFTIIPYGTIWADSVFATSRTVPGRFALWIASEEEQGEGAFELDARRSRVGIDIIGPTIGQYDSGGKVEVDFLGNFVTDNQPDVRLRHAYWEAKNEHARFLVGQTWDVVSPLLPNSVNFTASWAVGNIGFRRTQIRAERYIPLGAGMTWTLQGSLNQNVIQDLATGFSAAGVTRETGEWPMLEGRSAITFHNIQAGGKSMTLGTSGHIGETGFDFAQGHPANPALGPEDDVRLETWSYNFDAIIPLTEKFSLRGEFFQGRNLSNLLGGIGQGVCPCLRVPIDAIGGWAELRYEVNEKVATHIGYSIDDPDDNDSLIGRTKNQVLYTNLYYKISENLTTGFEVSTWRTDYHNRTSEPGFIPVAGATEPGKAVLFDATLRYAF
ncbi:hypothetical protein Q31b_49630 [Novipirellula aureliae]|uniref:Uncharacterized protein n=1 Tax=Novipirellula aureliae TaxID=2527966 RepID=A0A5C6DM11_9BACT|nr:DcaP family trimeric outer membrane transporter [Novipirellula aureliae]TWU36681.1 hypothetical protein Q31b_49630 [Novipirellula aureliae]